MLLAFRVSLFQCISYRSRARRLSSGPLRTGREGVCRLLSCVAPTAPGRHRDAVSPTAVSRVWNDTVILLCSCVSRVSGVRGFLHAQSRLERIPLCPCVK